MAMTKGKHPDRALSAVRVRSITEPGRYADGNGLYLIVEPSGAKRWMLRTIVQGKRRDIGLGGCKLVTLAEASKMALTFRKIARAGGDPLAERRKQRMVIPTFEQAVRSVHTEHLPKAKRLYKVPLADRALEILHRCKTLADDSEFIFPGRSAKKPLCNMVFLMALRRMGTESTAHGFRSAFRDWASERTNFRARFVNRPSPIRLRTKRRPHTVAATYSTRGAI
jgi:Arm DNA-binding domain